MIHDWRRKNSRLILTSDIVVGFAVLGGIVLLAAIVILTKGKDTVPNKLQTSSQTVRVIDGDTIDLNSERIRLYGIDAPEKRQPCKRNDSPYDCGAASKDYLEFILTGTKVECNKKAKDKWGRSVAQCTADGKDIGKLMVRNGWALAYRKYSTAYVKDEEFAQSNKLGMWAKDFSIPSEWRKSDRGDKL